MAIDMSTMPSGDWAPLLPTRLCDGGTDDSALPLCRGASDPS